MSNSSAFRIALGKGDVSIWSSEIFGQSEPSTVRDFLSRAFAVQEVDAVELRRAASFGRIRYGVEVNPKRIWKKLSQALSAREPLAPRSGAPEEPARRIDAGLVYLDSPPATPVRISRIGGALSTWRVREQSDATLHLSHPVLRNRRDVVFRLEEELAAIFGIEDFRASALTASVRIRFDNRALTAERLARELEKAWPRLLTGHEGPPSRKRFIAAGGMIGLSSAGEFLVPALLPLAKASVTLYAMPQVVKAAKQLAHGEVGVAALYTAGVGLMLFGAGGSPFTASVMASLMQLWPQLTHRKVIHSQRRLFGAQRRRPAWTRIARADGTDVEVNVDDLRKGDRIVVREGEVVAVDGVVEEGSAAVVLGPPLHLDRILDFSVGDAVSAGTFIHDGTLTLRVERTGAQTSASYVDSLLPHTLLAGLPSQLEAERVANRNAKPALALSAAAGFLTPNLRASRI